MATTCAEIAVSRARLTTGLDRFDTYEEQRRRMVDVRSTDRSASMGSGSVAASTNVATTEL